MTFVIQHPGRIDLFCNGAGEYVPLAQAKQFDRTTAQDIMGGGMEPGEKMIATPTKQPIHPISQVGNSIGRVLVSKTGC